MIEEDEDDNWGGKGSISELVITLVIERGWGVPSARDIKTIGNVCKIWKEVANNPHIWRIAVEGRLDEQKRKHLATAIRRGIISVSWIDEYWKLAAGWKKVGLNAVGGEVAVIALRSCGEILAVLTADARLSIWKEDYGKWKEQDSTFAGIGRWSRGIHVEWCPNGERILVGGRVALAERGEIEVYSWQEDGLTRGIRAGAAAGGAACWLTDDAFLTLELHLVAPRRAITAVLINSVSQEVQSEYAGVVAPLFYVYNEGAAAITHLLVANVPAKEDQTQDEDERSGHDLELTGMKEFYQCINEEQNKQTIRVLIAATGEEDSNNEGEARAIALWKVEGVGEVPPIIVDVSLRARVLARPRRSPSPPPEPPTVAELRFMCNPPDHRISLDAQITGMKLHPTQSCLIVSTSMHEVQILSIRGAQLQRLKIMSVTKEPGTPLLLWPYYIRPDINYEYLVSPVSGTHAVIWSLTTGGLSGILQLPAPAVATCFPSAKDGSQVLLVAAADCVYIWRQLTSTVE